MLNVLLVKLQIICCFCFFLSFFMNKRRLFFWYGRRKTDTALQVKVIVVTESVIVKLSCADIVDTWYVLVSCQGRFPWFDILASMLNGYMLRTTSNCFVFCLWQKLGSQSESRSCILSEGLVNGVSCLSRGSYCFLPLAIWAVFFCGD